MGCSLATLMDSFPSLLQCLMSAFTSAHEPLAVAAADALVDLLSPMNTPLSPSVERQVGMTHLMAEQLQRLAVTLGLPEAAAAEDGALTERQYHFCRALCAFAERAVDVVAGTDGRLLSLVQLLFCCLGAELRAADLTVDFWTCIGDTPLYSRHEQLRHPLYRELQVSWRCDLPPSVPFHALRCASRLTFDLVLAAGARAGQVRAARRLHHVGRRGDARGG